MPGGGERALATGDGLPVCHQCGISYHKTTAKFCRRCGASRDGRVGSGDGKPRAPRGGDGGLAVHAGGPTVISADSSSGGSTPVMPPLFPSHRAEGRPTAALNGTSGTLRPFEVSQLRQLTHTVDAGAAATPLEFRDPIAATSLTSPKKTVTEGRGTASATVPSSTGSSRPNVSAHKSAIYAKDGTLPELPPASLADPRRHRRSQSESSEEAESRLAATAVDRSTHGRSGEASGGLTPAAVAASRVPAPPREQPPVQGGRPSSASSLPSNGRQHGAKSRRQASAVEDAMAYADGGAFSAASAAVTLDGEAGEEATKSLHPTAEEEAQYTAWATLPPDGLTPEMLQTSNAAELRRWRKGSLIGRGTYGSVYLGLLPDGSFHAVKTVELGNKKAAADHLGVLELVSLSREINMMHRLRHRNLCTFKGVYYDADDSAICMFMEYIGGGSLSSLVKRFKPLPPSVVRSWTRQLLSGLQYLHAQHIIHRDIKGDNVLVDTSADPASLSQIKLVDFGAARRLTDAVSQSSTVIGTPYWMAPEVVNVSGEGSGYSYKADVWSVGCTVAEMLTGRPPWPCKASAPAAIMMIASATGMPTEIPEEEATPGCLDFMRQCFIRDPANRPTVQMLLQHPWILGNME